MFHMLIFSSLSWREDNKTQVWKCKCAHGHLMEQKMSHAATKPCIIYAGKMSIFHIIVHKLFYLVAKALQISCSTIAALHQPPFHLSALLELVTSTHTQTNMHMNSYALLHTLNRGEKSRCAHIVCLCYTPVKPQRSKKWIQWGRWHSPDTPPYVVRLPRPMPGQGEPSALSPISPETVLVAVTPSAPPAPTGKRH